MTLTEEQTKAVFSNAPTILCAATAGSGKTTTLVARILLQINGGHFHKPVPPSKIAAITFTVAAAAEIQKRIGRKIGFCGTLHAFMIRLLNKYGQLYGLPSDFSILDEEATAALMESKNVSASLLAEIGPEIVMDSKTRAFSKNETLAAGYYLALIDQRRLDFDSILKFGAILSKRLKDHPDVMGGNFYQHLLVDEVQDASPVDFQIYDALPVPNKFYCGDDDQAIMGFRGGSVAGTLELAKTAKLFVLSVNHRCPPSICDSARTLIEVNPDRISKPISSAHTDGPGFIEIAPAKYPMAEKMAVGIRLAAQHPSECAVIVRYNAQVIEWEGFLQAQGLKVRAETPLKLPKDWREAKRILAFAIDPDNDAVALEVITAQSGPGAANEIYHKALENFSSINEVGFGGMEPARTVFAATQVVLKGNLTEETKEIIKGIAGKLDPLSPASDLAAALEDYRREATTGSEGITVCTYHRAKGREWDYVFLPEFEDGYIPGNQKTVEERKLAYVGMTRAKKSLTITYCTDRPVVDHRESKGPSPFIKEAGL